jgi:type IX secretion system PorP/SprF family membrane protein
MKKYILFACVLWTGQLEGQEIPLFTQKLTNSFLYNPAIAGIYSASLTYSYRRNYGLVGGSPEDHFVSVQTPFFGDRFGIGITAYQENVNFIRTSFSSAAFAYHLQISRYSKLSFGTAAEYNSLKVVNRSNTLSNGVDPVIIKYQDGTPGFDASAGANFQNKYFSVGLAANRLASSWTENEYSALTNYFSGYAQGTIPARNKKDSFEPYVSFRKFSAAYVTWDLGVFYLVNNRFISGIGLRKGDVIHTTIAFRLPKKLMIGYGHEIIGSTYGSVLGSSSEVVVRYDFTPSLKKSYGKMECIAGDPYGVQINTRYRSLNKKPLPFSRSNKVARRSFKRRSKY